jgi:hypothetical protein
MSLGRVVVSLFCGGAPLLLGIVILWRSSQPKDADEDEDDEDHRYPARRRR